MEKIKKLYPYILTILLTVFLIYLTPLKWLNLVEPKIVDTDPKIFYDKYIQNKDDYLFIDVRSESSYNERHAEGSINAPLHTLYDIRHALPKRGKKIVLICSGGRASGVAYSYLEHYGFFNVERIEGGIEEWVERGLPTVPPIEEKTL